MLFNICFLIISTITHYGYENMKPTAKDLGRFYTLGLYSLYKSTKLNTTMKI